MLKEELLGEVRAMVKIEVSPLELDVPKEVVELSTEEEVAPWQ